MTGVKRLLNLALVIMSALAIAACGGHDHDDHEHGDSTGATAATGFSAGTFQLYTIEVSDKCLDGGLDLLFQPDGENTEYKLENTTEIPGSADLPADLTVKLQDPFSDMAVKIEADGDNMKVVGAVQEDVVIDADKYGDCNADMTVDLSITIMDDNNLTVAASLSVSDWQGDNCPEAQADPCMVNLTMRGERQN